MNGRIPLVELACILRMPALSPIISLSPSQPHRQQHRRLLRRLGLVPLEQTRLQYQVPTTRHNQAGRKLWQLLDNHHRPWLLLRYFY